MTQPIQPVAKRNPVGALIDDWQETRQALREVEAAEHPNITDALGRVWAWKNKDLYTHDGMAWTQEMVARPNLGLPTAFALDNPNYQWCSTCKPAVSGATR